MAARDDDTAMAASANSTAAPAGADAAQEDYRQLALMKRVLEFDVPRDKFIQFRLTHETHPVQADFIVRVGMKTAWKIDYMDPRFLAFERLAYEEQREKKRPDGGWPIKEEFRYLAAERVLAALSKVGVDDFNHIFRCGGHDTSFGERQYVHSDDMEDWVDGAVVAKGEKTPHVLTAPPEVATESGIWHNFIHGTRRFGLRSAETLRLFLGPHDGGSIIDATVILDPKTHRVVAFIPLIDGWKTDIRYINYPGGSTKRRRTA